MNRALTYINLAGVILLAALAVAQWKVNRRTNLQAIQLEKVGQEQSAKIIEQDKIIKGQAADLDMFRSQLTKTHASLKETESKLNATEKEVRQLSDERDQLKVSVTNWAAAVTARDEQLKLANAELKKLGEDRNEVVGKFNDLAARYNSVVKDLNEARGRLSATNSAATNRSGK